MKKMTLACIMLAAMISSPVFAYEIYKGKITSHKEWTTGSAKGKFKMSRANTSLNRFDENSLSGIAQSFVKSKFATVNQTVNVEGAQYVSIKNRTDSTQEYYYVYSLCSNYIGKFSECVHYQNNLTLEAGGYFFDDNTVAELEMNYPEAGRYATRSSVMVSEPNGDAHAGAGGEMVVS